MLENLAKLVGNTAATLKGDLYESDPANAAVEIVFSGGTKLRTDYWRLIKIRRL